MVCPSVKDVQLKVLLHQLHHKRGLTNDLISKNQFPVRYKRTGWDRGGRRTCKEMVQDRRGVQRETACVWLANPTGLIYAQLLASSTEVRTAGFGSELRSL